MKKASEIKTNALNKIKYNLFNYFEYKEKGFDDIRRDSLKQLSVLVWICFSYDHMVQIENMLIDSFIFDTNGLGKIDFESVNQIECLKIQLSKFFKNRTDDFPLSKEVFKAINLI